VKAIRQEQCAEQIIGGGAEGMKILEAWNKEQTLDQTPMGKQVEWLGGLHQKLKKTLLLNHKALMSVRR